MFGKRKLKQAYRKAIRSEVINFLGSAEARGVFVSPIVMGLIYTALKESERCDGFLRSCRWNHLRELLTQIDERTSAAIRAEPELCGACGDDVPPDRAHSGFCCGDCLTAFNR